MTNNAVKGNTAAPPTFGIGDGRSEMTCEWWAHLCNRQANHHLHTETAGETDVEFYCQRHYVPALATWLNENQDDASAQLVDWGIY